MRTYRESNGLRSFSQLIRPWSGQITMVVILVGLLALGDMVLPWALALLVDDVFPALADKNGGWELLTIILVSLCTIYVLRNVLYFISRMISVRVSEHVCFDLRQRLFDHMQQLGMDFYKSNRPGKISSRVMDDTFRIQTFIQDKLPTLLRYIIEFQILLILLYVVNWKLALASTIVLPLHILTYKRFYLPIKDSHNRAQEHLAEAHGNLVETFMGAQVIKGFSAEKRESESFLQTIRAGREDQIKTKRFQFVQKVIADLLVGAGTVLLLGYGAWEVYAGSMTIGMFLMFFWYVRMLYPAVLEIISGTGHFSQTSASVDRVLNMLDEPVDDIAYDMRTRARTMHLVGPIEFKDVWFDFDENTNVLENINLCIDAGEHIAITGPSGGGKSTLISLMPRFNDPMRGIISIGGHDIKDMRLQDVRGIFGIAFQDAFLFNASILDNLRYARPNAKTEEIINACKLTGAHDVIEQLPARYNARIGDQGVELSHGQKQRINLARALVRNPQTLIIDEITASIDAKAAKQIIKTVLEHMSGRTVIIVTHDPSLLALAHRVITLDNKTITDDQYKDGTNMKHPAAKLSMLFLALSMFVGCSTTDTTSIITMEDPKSTGIIFEEEDPVNLLAFADAFEAMMAENIKPITHATTIAPPPVVAPSPAEIAELIEESERVTSTSLLLDLPRLNPTELDEVLQRLTDLYALGHGYTTGNNSIDKVLPSLQKNVHHDLTLVKKTSEQTKIIRFGHQVFISQPSQLWVEGYTIDNNTFSGNTDAEFVTAYTTELFASLETTRANLSVLDLEKKIIQLSYIDAPSAIQMLNGLGVSTFAKAEDVPDEVTWSSLPYVVQIPEPTGTDTGLVGGTGITGGNFGLTMVPSAAVKLGDKTISSPMTQLMVFFDPARPETFSDVRRMVTELVDRAARQIFIEGMVLEINEDGIKDIGINWHMFDANTEPTHFEIDAGKKNAGAAGDTFNFTLLDLNLERAFTKFNEWWFDVDVRAMVRDGKAEILSRPSILTLNNRQATIRVGEDIPIATSTAGMSNADMLSFNFKYLPTGIMLNIRPRIAEDGKEVSMMIDTIVSSKVPGADLTITDTSGTVLASAPTISSRRVQTYAQIQVDTASTEFVGYERLTVDSSLIAIIKDGHEVESLQAGESGILVLPRTPFYAEGGGQVGDTGLLKTPSATFVVTDTQYLANKVIGHFGALSEGSFNVGDQLEATVSATERRCNAANHSATHLLHQALKDVLGDHVQQKGSLVSATRLRFDFSHFEPLQASELEQIEQAVNQQVCANLAVAVSYMELDEAKAKGAAALFGEKYEDEVRVVEMGNYSLELCAGTHVHRTGDIGFFKLESETGIAAGVRRIEVQTGAAAVKIMQQQSAQLTQLSYLLKALPSDLENKISGLVATNKALDKELKSARSKLAMSGAGQGLAEKVSEINGIKVMVVRQDGADVKTLRSTVDAARSSLGEGIVIVAGAFEGKVSIIVTVAPSLTEQYPAGQLIKPALELVDGRGGGKPDMAQGGGAKLAQLDAALEAIKNAIAAA